MQQILQQGHSLDPGQPLRNEALYMKPKSREEESWKKFHHKHKQVFGQMFQLQEKEVKEDLPLKRPKSWKRGEADNLWKHLWRSRRYGKKRDEDNNCIYTNTVFHPVALYMLKHHPGGRATRGLCEGFFLREHVYRQLCCLTWLLEALTLGHSGKFGPVASCWDARDPGRSRNIHKSVYREKLIQAKWDRLISPPKSLRPGIRLSHITSLTHKSSGLNTMSSSVLTTSVLSNMSSCDVTFSGEENLQVLLDEVHQSVSKELYGSTKDCSCETDIISFETLRAQYNTQESTVTRKLESHTAKSSLNSQASTVFSQEKAAMLAEMQLMFKERTRELSLNLTETLDLKAKKRWMSGVQRYHSLSNISRGSSSSVPCATQNPQVQEFNTPDTPYSTQWLSALIRSLPSHTHSNRKLVCVVEKLKRYTQEKTLRIRPHVFFRVLNSLQPWELCCPELCVAIEQSLISFTGFRSKTYDICSYVDADVEGSHLDLISVSHTVTALILSPPIEQDKCDKVSQGKLTKNGSVTLACVV
ncbi:hypothetical protein C0J50_11715 [Silurus asotus]|uniref:Uncharacterized protein n=1 Tax=Silurus asotus TaxID=30991 RepID=A0AAD5ACE6_SILAS|nr:hypothetical protein C0J50_11715 [Silurus asotus]